MENPEVSVIIPVYNNTKYLGETIASLRTQTFKDFEVLIIDNGSDQEDTLNALKEYANEHQLIRIEEASLPLARNVGLKHAKGKYILPLDSDDIISPSFIEKCLKLMKSDPACKVVRTQVRLFGKKKGVLVFADYSFSLLLARNLMVVTSLFKKEDALAVGGYDVDLHFASEDWEFWINLLKDGGKVLTVNEPLFHYRILRGSKNRSIKLEEYSKARRMIWEKHSALFSKHFLDPNESFEYKLITESMAYRLGKLITSPFNRFRLMP